ncbi:MAG: hypothetical protein ABJA74_16810 [Lapillicoccus sp.]
MSGDGSTVSGDRSASEVFAASIPLAFLVYGWALIRWSLVPVAMMPGMAVARRRHPRAAAQ